MTEPLESLTEIYDPLVPIAYAGLVVLGLFALSRRSFTKAPAVALAATLSVIITDAVKVLLKYVLGRSPPTILFSRVHPGELAYGFNWFYSGASSFPSGHTAAVCAVLAVLWRCYPRGRPLYVVVALAVAVVLIAMSFHFLSDVIAGALLGTSIGWWIAQVTDRRFEICARRD